MWLVGEPETSTNFLQRSRSIDRRLRSLLAQGGVKDPARLKNLTSQLATLHGSLRPTFKTRKAGLHTIDESTARHLMIRQNYRCGVCGVPFASAVRKASARFDNSLEPLAEAHLEHVSPYYLFGNEVEYELLCGACNLLKNDRIGVHEDGFVISANHLRSRVNSATGRRMAFWSLYAARKCEYPDCEGDAKSTLLYIEPRNGGLFTYGNLDVRCEIHAGPEATWIHGAHLGE